MSTTKEDSYSRLESDTIDRTTAFFLLNSKVDKYYKGKINKESGNIPKGSDWFKGYQEFYSYKFISPINGALRTFCVTFRQKPSGGYYVRLSLIEEDSKNPKESLARVTCKDFHESLILDSLGRPGKPAEFSSITSGLGNPRNTRDTSKPIDSISIVKEMEELDLDAPPRSLPHYIIYTTGQIKLNIAHLGQLLVKHCDEYAETSQSHPPAPAPPTFTPSLEQSKTSESVTFENGDTYTGTFLKGKKHGKGLYKWVNDDKYYGDWDDGKRHGKGGMTLANGDTYDGDWSNDMFTGDGVYKSTNGNTYNGKWLNNKKDGKGVYTWANHDTYDGDWVNNKRQGEGVFTWANDNTTYTGHWSNDKFNGYGVQIYSNGDKYEGNYVDGKKHGEGVYKYSNGDMYKGDYVDGKKNGKGVYTDASNGNKTTQNWNNGKMVEEGVATGGATRRHTRLTRRRKSVFKRKGKKSYRKKKYGKTKKSRRFRRSVRSRR